MVLILHRTSEKSIDQSSASTSDQARALIQNYRESEWRSTRLEVLRSLGKFQDSRSLQFLIDICSQNQDLAEQQAAILSISQRRTPAARAFLRGAYQKAPDTLKAHLAYSLGQVHDFGSVDVLLKDMDVALSRKDGLWLRNLVLSLGELKAFESLQKLERLLERTSDAQVTDRELSLALLFALGKLERDADWLQTLEPKFSEDSLQYQVFQSALAQIQIRSQLKMEDYIHKIFNSPSPHPILPLELKAFDSGEVTLSLELFPMAEHWRRHLIALQGVPPKDRASFIQQILDLNLPEPELLELYDLAVPLLDDDVDGAKILALLNPKPDASPEVRLHWLALVAPRQEIASQAEKFLSGKDTSQAIRYLNLWSEWAMVRPTSESSKAVSKWVKEFNLNPVVYGRLVRACAELKLNLPPILDRFSADFKKAELRSSLLFYLERLPKSLDSKKLIAEVMALSSSEKESLGVRILGVFEAFLDAGNTFGEKAATDQVASLLKSYAENFNLDLRVGVLQVLRRMPLPAFETYAIEQTKHQNPLVELNAVIALKSYAGSRAASEALAEKLESISLVVQGRALDSLCAHTSLVARRAVMQFLATHLDQEAMVDKIYRSFDPEAKGGEEFVKAVDQILKTNPDHPQWEKLVSLRDRLFDSQAASQVDDQTLNPEALKELDARLLSLIPLFGKLDMTTQSALRAAEQPLLTAGDLQNLPVDKAPTVLEYCKALDLILEKHLGQKHLFPKLDTQLHDFQTLWHRVGFGEDYPSIDKVVPALGLKGKVTPENFPLHKAKMMCATFFNGKILQDRFKVFDGLRAWAVIFLVFARKITLPTGVVGPMLKLPNATDEKCISIAKRLMVLQDLRNPAAHRQTYTDFASVKFVRDEAIALVNVVLELVI
jgi:hypothetical protein